MKMKQEIQVKGVNVRVIKIKDEDFISLTDMLSAKDGDFFISDWLRNRNTIEFLGIWEQIHNPDFNYGEFATIRNKAGLNNYKISVKEWVSKTNSIALKASAGRYGGSYAHKDIAFEFGMWISAEFKIYLIKEFQRLKEEENKQQSLEWNVKRTLAKINYKIHTDAIKESIIPKKIEDNTNFIYANEADLLNVALFNTTAKEWRKANKSKKGNLRDYATIEQLVVLSNLESINAEFIRLKFSKEERVTKLNEIAINQMKSLVNNKYIKQLENKK